MVLTLLDKQEKGWIYLHRFEPPIQSFAWYYLLQASVDEQQKFELLIVLCGLKKTTLKIEEYVAWKDASVYGLSINGRRVTGKDLLR